MSIGKNKKISILTLALTALFAFALSLFSVVPANAEFDADTAFTYVVNGKEAYLAVEDSSATNKDELMAKLQNVSDLSVDYFEALNPSNFDMDAATVDEVVEVFTKYDAFMGAVEEYNSIQPLGPAYAISVPEMFNYGVGVGSVDTDILDASADKMYESIAEIASGWENATESEYAISYYVSDANSNVLFIVYASEDKQAYVVPVAEGLKIIENKMTKGLAVDLVFAINDVEYNVVISVAKKNDINADNLSMNAVYSVSILSAYDELRGPVNDTFFVYMDESYASYSATVKEIKDEANAFFAVPVRSEVLTKYVDYTVKIVSKIAAVVSVEMTKLSDKLNAFDPDLYSNTAISEIEEVVEVFTLALLTVASYDELVSLSNDTYTAIASVKSIPEDVRDNYSDVLVENKNYIRNNDTDCEYNRALELLSAMESYNSSVMAVLANERETVLANITRSGEKSVRDLAEDVDTTTLSSNQIREIAEQLQATLTAIRAAGDDFEAIDNAVNAFSTFANNVLSTYTTVDSVENGNVKVVGKLDSRAQLSATTGAVTKDTDIDAIEEGKRQDVVTRRLSALEIFDITLSVDNKEINYVDDNGYTVTVKLDAATLEIFKTRGVDPESVIVAFVDENGKLETYETTLSFTYDDGTVVVYGDASVNWDKIAEGSIMFVTQHFSSYYFMGNTSNLAFVRFNNLLSGLADSKILLYALIGIGALIGVLLLFVFIAFLFSVGTKYTIKFVRNGGSRVRRIRKKYGKKLPELKTPVREGYVFTGWCIDPTLRYEFNRKVMPRSNVKLYARWMSEEEFASLNTPEDVVETTDNTAVIVEYYDKLRAKLATYKKPVQDSDKSFVEQEVLAKLYAEDNSVKVLVKTNLNYINEKDGVAYVVADADKFEEVVVNDEASFNAAVSAIEKMANVNGLVAGEAVALEPSTYEDAVLGYAYIINYTAVANFNERYNALRNFALTFGLTDESKTENGKVVFELVPNGEAMYLALSLDMAKYGKVLTAGKVDGAVLENAYAVNGGEDMGVAFELVERVLCENGFTAQQSEVEYVAFEAEIYQFVIDLGTPEEVVEEPVEEVVEEPVEEVVEEATEETVEEVVEETTEEVVEEVAEEVVEEEVEMTATELLAEVRKYSNSFAMFVEEGVEPDTSVDGTVVVKACIKDGVVVVTADPDADAVEATVESKNDLTAAYEAINAAMTKYGMEVDPDYVPGEQVEGESFGFRIKF